MSDQNSSDKKHEKAERFLGRIFISIVVFIVCFLVIDKISLLFISPLSTYDQEYGPHMMLKPYVMHGGVPNFVWEKGGTSHNALGYRGERPVMPKPKGEYRIFVLGGSTVYSGNPSLPECLQERFLRGGFSNVKVYNYGFSGLLSGESLARIVFEVSELNPDYIIMYNGANDILQPVKADPRPGYLRDFFAMEKNPLLIKGLKDYPKYVLFMYGFNLPRHFFREYFIDKFSERNKLRKEVRYMYNDWRVEIAKTYIGNIIKASVVAKAFGAQFTAFFQPTLYFKDPLSAEETEFIRGLSVNRAHALITRNAILKTVGRYPAQKIFVDISDIFDTHPETVFVDDFHIKDEKNKIVAEKIYQYVVDRLRSR